MGTVQSTISGHAIAICTIITLIAGMAPEAKGAASRPGPSYLDLAKAYADAMIEKGRDTYGEVHSPLFAATLDRKTYKIGNQPLVSRSSDANPYGANVQEDVGLYYLLQGLTRITGDKKYRVEYEKCFEFFYKETQSPVTGLYPWGEHLYWNFLKEGGDGWKMMHEANFVWPFWDDAYRMAPENAWKYAVGMLDNGIILNKGDGIAQYANKITFSRHTQYDRRNPWQGSEYPRIGGQFMWIFADAYGRPENKERDRREELKKAAVLVLEHYETKLKTCGYIPAAGGPDGTKYYGQGKGRPGDRVMRIGTWTQQNFELARCAWFAAQAFDEPLARRFRNLALAVEQISFVGSKGNPTQHRIAEGGGFQIVAGQNLRGPDEYQSPKRDEYTVHWATRYGLDTTASFVVDWMLPRYEQIKDELPAVSTQHHKVFKDVAKIYMEDDPDADATLTPGSFEPVIRLMGFMYDWTKDKKYLDRANHFAQLAVWELIDGVSPLPKANNRMNHYATKTRGAELMNTLFQLHQWGIRPQWNYPARIDLAMDANYHKADRATRVRMLIQAAPRDEATWDKVEEILFRMPTRETDQELHAALDGEATRALAVKVLARRHDPALKPKLKALLVDLDAGVRKDAWFALGRSAEDSDIERVLADIGAIMSPGDHAPAADALLAIFTRSEDKAGLFAKLATHFPKVDDSQWKKVFCTMSENVRDRAALDIVAGLLNEADVAVKEEAQKAAAAMIWDYLNSRPNLLDMVVAALEASSEKEVLSRSRGFVTYLSAWSVSNPVRDVKLEGSEVFKAANAGDLDWSPFKGNHHQGGGIDLNDYLKDSNARWQQDGVFVRTIIESPIEQPAKVQWTAAGDAIPQYGGQPVETRKVSSRRENQTRSCDLTLKKGRNELLFKIPKGRYGWSLKANISTPDGKTIEGLNVKPD